MSRPQVSWPSDGSPGSNIGFDSTGMPGPFLKRSCVREEAMMAAAAWGVGGGGRAICCASRSKAYHPPRRRGNGETFGAALPY